MNIEQLKAAHLNGERPVAPGEDLREADLRGVDLHDADLSGANLSKAKLAGANLRGANLRGADLSGADLRRSDLRDADLRDANLRVTDMRAADLRIVDLSGADLRRADLAGADLHKADQWGGFQLNGLPSGQVVGVPTIDGWMLQVDCWVGTPDELRALIAKDTDWPQAEGPEIARRRPGLELMLTLFDEHQVLHADKLAEVIANWG